MPRRNRDGKFILSASEIGSFTVCAESWRLRTLEKVSLEESENEQQGQKMHETWSARFDEFIDLDRASRLVIALLVLAFAVFLLLGEHSVIG